MDITYKQYVKKDLWKDFVKMCRINSRDFYSAGCVTTAHLVMKDLMKHTYKGVWKERKVIPKVAWNDAMRQSSHSGMSAAITATIIAKFSPRGKEFRDWCIKEDIVMVDWK